MPRPTKEQIDEEILDAAAALFARHGLEQTSVQRIADAVGYSKTGLLHRFPTKEAIAEATITHTVEHFEAVAGTVAGTPPGADRDRRVLTALATLAADRPGLVSFMLTSISRGVLAGERLDVIGEVLFRAFGAVLPAPGTTPTSEEVTRAVRITSAVGGLAVASLAFCEAPDTDLRALSGDLLAAALGALGHRRDATPHETED
ncbi:TetR/AcrR family transcriptional regulator [Kineococcus sp. TBRC 1896]|uniref:TetR/AcrR family transcriptional regulator n=1 Tax=Kineococcus mangrovi TaxID=1660183 RepID=A0ABV4I644_9ACTN